MKSKRLLSMLLCAIMLASAALTGCSESGANADETTPVTTPDAAAENVAEDGSASAEGSAGGDGLIAIEADYDWTAGVQKKDYEGYEYTILNGCTASWYSYNSISPEETTGEPVNDAFIERENRTEEFLNISIKELHDGDSLNILKNAVKSGSNDFDYGNVTLMNCYAVAMEGNVFDLNTIAPDAGVDLSNVWWDQNARDNLTINGQLYFMTSDADTTRFDSIRSLYFNKEMIEQNGLQNPYELVDSNQWTVDKFTEMCTSVIVDKDGDGVMTDKDQYGWISYTEIMSDLLMCGMGTQFITKDPDTGMLTDGTVGENFVDMYNKVINLLFTQQNAVFDVRASSRSSQLRGLGDRAQETIFTENGALFYSECMAWTRVLRDMEADFGVLPPPKYNEDQDRYYSIILNPFMQMIPVTSQDPARTLHVLDVFSAASHDTVVDAYVNVTLTGKVARDQDTVRMLHLVFDELYYNIHFSSVSIRSTVNSAISSGSDSIASMLKKTEKAVTKQLAKTNEFFFPEG